MKIKINITKGKFFILMIIILIMGGILIVLAYRPNLQWNSFQPSKMGHSVDEIDWSQSIDREVKLIKDGRDDEPTLELTSNDPLIGIQDVNNNRVSYINVVDDSLKIAGGNLQDDDFIIRDGNVGIGINNPTTALLARLYVKGGIRFGDRFGGGVTLTYVNWDGTNAKPNCPSGFISLIRRYAINPLQPNACGRMCCGAYLYPYSPNSCTPEGLPGWAFVVNPPTCHYYSYFSSLTCRPDYWTAVLCIKSS